MVAMAHRLRLRVVAEGVETADQLGKMQEYGCEAIRGSCSPRRAAPDFVTSLDRPWAAGPSCGPARSGRKES